MGNSLYTVGGFVFQYGGSNSNFYPSNNTQRFSDLCVEQHASPKLVYPTNTPTPTLTYTPTPVTHLAIYTAKTCKILQKLYNGGGRAKAAPRRPLHDR